MPSIPRKPPLGMLEEMPGGFRAWHGSPHKFDRFDYSKIGTGEGNQAFGHGLYLAGARPTAETYQRMLSEDPLLFLAGPQVSIPKEKAFSTIKYLPKDADPYASSIVQDTLANVLNFHMNPEDAFANITRFTAPEHTEAARNIMNELQPKRIGGGHLYDVKVHEDPQRLLDLDQPLAEQSKTLQEPFSDIRRTRPRKGELYTKDSYFDIDKQGNYYLVIGGNTDPNGGLRMKIPPYDPILQIPKTGGDFMRQLGRTLASSSGKPGLKEGAVLASERLQEAGVPGLKYLSEGGTGGRTGTSQNVVMHSAEPIEILKRYAVAGGAPMIPPAPQGTWGDTPQPAAMPMIGPLLPQLPGVLDDDQRRWWRP